MCCASDTYAPGHLVDSVTASLCSQTWIIDTSEALQFNWEFGTQCWCLHCFNYAHNYPSQTPFDLPYMVKIYFSGSVPLLLPYFCRHYSSTENLGPSVGAHIASDMPTITHQRLLLIFPTWSKSTSVVLYLFCCHTSVDITVQLRIWDPVLVLTLLQLCPQLPITDSFWPSLHGQNLL